MLSALLVGGRPRVLYPEELGARGRALAVRSYRPATRLKRSAYRLWHHVPVPNRRLARARLLAWPLSGNFDWEGWWRECERRLDRGPLQPIGLWPPQAGRRRFTFLALRANEEPVAVARLAFGAEAGTLATEVRALRRIAELQLERSVAPRVLDDGARGPARFLLLSHLHGRPAGLRLGRPLRDAWRELAERTATTGDLDALQVAALPEAWSPVRRALHRAFANAAPLAATHGDFAPWNLGRGRAGAVLLDWEHFRSAAPRLADPLHFLLSVGIRVRRSGSRRLARRLLAFSENEGLGREELLLALADAAVTCRWPEPFLREIAFELMEGVSS